MRLLFSCLVILLVALTLLGAGPFNFELPSTAEGVPASISQWWGLIEMNATQYDVDPVLVAAVMMQESGGKPQARSSAGANGLMQVLNGPFDPSDNVQAGVRILAKHLDEFKDVRIALAAYNAGPGMTDAQAAKAVEKYAGVRGAARRAKVSVSEFDRYVKYLPAETRRYVPAVLTFYERFKGGSPTAAVYEGNVRYPLDKFRWSATYGKNIGNGQAWHTGEDLIAPCGTPVKAAFDGDLVYKGCLYGNCKDGGAAKGATGHGRTVVQQFDGDHYAVYAHLSSYTSERTARAGDVIGYIGMTGWTTGCHLHYAIWGGTLDDLLKGEKRQNWLDPKKFFPNVYPGTTATTARALAPISGN